MFVLFVLISLVLGTSGLAVLADKPSRRRALRKIFQGGIVATPTLLGMPIKSLADDSKMPGGSEDELEKRRKALLAEKIAASKKIYRKPEDLFRQRWDSKEKYECVSTTGSPCKADEADSSNGQLEDI